MTGLIEAKRREFSTYDGEIFTDEYLADSRDLFRMLRDLGDLVWVPAIDMFVIARFKDVVTALRAPEKLISGKGVSVNAEQNALAHLIIGTLQTDGDRHRQFRRMEMRSLSPSAIGALKERIGKLADDRVAMLANGQTFDAVEHLANHLPCTVVAEMVGIQGVDSERMLGWSNALFDSFGPPRSGRLGDTDSIVSDFLRFMEGLKREDLVPAGWADQLFDAAEEGEITLAEAKGLTGDYIIPSLDTTIYSTAEMLYRLATVVGAWDKLRANPKLIPGIVDEAVRMATPLRGFTRLAVEDFQLSESVIPAGSRVWLMYGAANLDERKYPNPDHFDVERNPRDQLGWGHGVHLCLGKNLARLEMESILRALLKNVRMLEADTPKRLINNSAQGYSELMMRMRAR
jgi:cytochrome P450